MEVMKSPDSHKVGINTCLTNHKRTDKNLHVY